MWKVAGVAAAVEFAPRNQLRDEGADPSSPAAAFGYLRGRIPELAQATAGVDPEVCRAIVVIKVPRGLGMGICTRGLPAALDLHLDVFWFIV